MSIDCLLFGKDGALKTIYTTNDLDMGETVFNNEYKVVKKEVGVRSLFFEKPNIIHFEKYRNLKG